MDLIQQGLKKGDKVSLFLKNSDLFVICAYAIWKAGGVVVPVNYRLTAKELHYIVEQSDSVTVITDDEQASVVLQTIEQEEVKAFCRESLASYKIPRHFIYTEVLPRNASGKILKYNLRDQWRDSRIMQ